MVKQIARLHGVHTVSQGESTFLLEVILTQEHGFQCTWVDASMWSRQELMQWLGY